MTSRRARTLAIVTMASSRSTWLAAFRNTLARPRATWYTARPAGRGEARADESYDKSATEASYANTPT